MSTHSPHAQVPPRPLPPGWVTHFDDQTNIWYYIYLDVSPPRVSYIHPDDQGSTSHTSHKHRSAVSMKAPIRSNQATFAQQLYASSLPGCMQTKKDENLSGSDPAMRSWISQHNFNQSQSPPSSFSTSAPRGIPLSPMMRQSQISLSPAQSPQGRTDKRTVKESSSLIAYGPAEIKLPKTTSSTVLIINNATKRSSQQLVPSNGRVPTYSLKARSPSVIDSACQPMLTTPAFQSQSPTSSLQPPSSPLLISPAASLYPSVHSSVPRNALSSINAAILPSVVPVPQVQIPNQSTYRAPLVSQPGSMLLSHTSDNSSNNHNDGNAVKKIGIAVGKTAGKAALKIGANVLLSSMGLPTANVFSPTDNNGGLIDIIAESLTNVAASAASQTLHAAVVPAPNTSSPIAQSFQAGPDLTNVLNQMEALQISQQDQQFYT